MASKKVRKRLGAAFGGSDLALIMAAMEPLRSPQEQILSALKKGPITKTALLSRCAASESTVMRIVRTMKERGEVGIGTINKPVAGYAKGTRLYYLEGT